KYTVASTGFAVLTPKNNTDPGYVGYVGQSELFINQIVARSIGVAYPAISETELGRCLVWFPTLKEQTQIAKFLDWKTTQINKFIRNKRRLIELLKEQKQNIINQAVTRGLDPNVKLKPSGVDWIGDIPEHWEVCRLKYLLREVDERSKTGAEYHLSMSQKHGGLVGSSEIKERRLMSENYTGGKLCEYGDIVLNRLKAHLGIFAHAPCDGVISPDYSVFRAISDIEPIYYEYLFCSTVMRPEFRIRCKGIVEGFWRLYSNDFLSLKVPVPSREEQLKILDGIRVRFSIIDQAITRAEREIELMREYRTRLISDVVTGQVDVRAIEVPDVVEEDMLDLEEDPSEAMDDELEAGED
ncbi:restriction endonuclease subunit S, partial [Synechocystis salina]